MITTPHDEKQSPEQEEDVISIAIRWFVRLRADDKTDAEYDQFFDWLFDSQRNQQAFAEIFSLWDSLEVIKHQRLDEHSEGHLVERHLEEQSAFNLIQKNTNCMNLRSVERSRFS